MSEREFENYLSLLSGLLRLNPSQRAQIAGELRDHMHERLAELTQQGMTREQAIAAALDEFGDAAGLAGEFSRIAHQHKRSLIMRYTLTTIAAGSIAALIVISLLPAQPPLNLSNLVTAQADPAAIEQATQAQKNSPDAITEAKLTKRMSAQFEGVTLTEALGYIRSETDTDFLVKWRHLGIDGEEQFVSLNLRDVRADILLEFVLGQVNEAYSYAIHDGVVVVSTVDDLPPEIRIYNCRDLLKFEEAGAVQAQIPARSLRQPSTHPTPRGVNPRAVAGQHSGRAGMRGGGGFDPLMGMGLMPGMMGARTGRGGGLYERAPYADRVSKLISLVQNLMPSIRTHTQGEIRLSIAEYDGLLVIQNTRAGHMQIAKLLEMLRQATASQEGQVVSATPSE